MPEHPLNKRTLIGPARLDLIECSPSYEIDPPFVHPHVHPRHSSKVMAEGAWSPYLVKPRHKSHMRNTRKKHKRDTHGEQRKTRSHAHAERTSGVMASEVCLVPGMTLELLLSVKHPASVYGSVGIRSPVFL